MTANASPSPSDHSAQSDLVQKLRAKFGASAPTPPTPTLSDDGVLDEFVRSMLLWESTSALAEGAWQRLVAGVVDANELRVCSPREVVAILGADYPLAFDRAERLHAALADAFKGQHKLTQAGLAEHGKREARAFLEAIDGTPPFVAARVVLLHLSGHAAPVDSRVLRRLIESGTAPRGRSCTEAASHVERHVRAGELMEFYLLVQAWADELPPPEPQAGAPGLGKVVAREGASPTRPRPARSSSSRPPQTGRGRPASEKS